MYTRIHIAVYHAFHGDAALWGAVWEARSNQVAL
jgi:hypothetical protein